MSERWLDRVLFFGERRRLRPLQEHLELAPCADEPRRLQGRWRGWPVRVFYSKGGRHERARLSLTLSQPLPLKEAVTFHRETWRHRLAKAVGLTAEPTSDDPAFDARIFCESWDDALAAAVVQCEVVRRAATEPLAETRRTQVTSASDGITLTIHAHWGWRSCFQPEQVARYLDQLAALADAVQAADLSTPPNPTAGQQSLVPIKQLPTAARIAVVAGPLSMFIGPPLLWASTWYPPVTWRLHLIGLALGGALLATYLLITFVWLRGRSRSHRDFGTFAFAATIGWPTLAMGLLVLSNGLLDRSLPVRVTAVIEDISQNNGDFQAKVRFHRSGGPPVQYAAVPLPRQPRRGEHVQLMLAAGALGEPWLVESTATPPTSQSRF